MNSYTFEALIESVREKVEQRTRLRLVNNAALTASGIEAAVRSAQCRALDQLFNALIHEATYETPTAGQLDELRKLHPAPAAS